MSGQEKNDQSKTPEKTTDNSKPEKKAEKANIGKKRSLSPEPIPGICDTTPISDIPGRKEGTEEEKKLLKDYVLSFRKHKIVTKDGYKGWTR